MEPNFLLIVKVPRGIIIRDTPRPESEGGRAMRTEAVGKQLYAYSIHNINGVPYARLVPQNPVKPEWVRVREADSNTEYVDVISIKGSDQSSMIAIALVELADAIKLLANKK